MNKSILSFTAVCMMLTCRIVSAAPGDILFSDDFEGIFSWNVSNGNLAGVNTLTTSTTDNYLFTRGGVVTVTSPAVDTSGASQIDINFDLVRGADNFFGAGTGNTNSENPENNEDLEVGYIDNAANFVILETFTGGGAQGESFSRSFTVSGAALHANFRVRVRQTGGSGGPPANGGKGWDYWHVNDVEVSETVTASSCSFSTGLISGLPGDYFNNMTLSAPAADTRVDGPVDFNWAGGSPGVAGVSNNNFSVRWDGVVRVTTTDTYRFQTVSDDGVRLYVDNVLIIDNWTDHAATTNTSANVALSAGEVYDIRLEFYENGGLAEIRLRWGRSGTGFSYSAIPAGPSPAYGEGLYYCTNLIPLAEWRMDESSWNGTSGEVVDETGTFNGTALNGATTTSASPVMVGDPGTCGYGEFPFNSSVAPPVAVDTGVSIDSDVGNAGTITLWYKSNVNWSGGGDRSILDAANAAAAGGAKYFFLTLLNNGQLRYGFEDTADGDYRINSPAQPVSANTWVHIAVTWDLPGDSLAIFVNGSQVASGTPNTNGVMGELKPLFIGDNNGEYIISGDTTSNSANGSIDEVRIYNTVLSAGQITTIMNETHACTVSVAETIYLSTDNDATLGGLSFEDGDLVEYDIAADITTSPPFFDESADPPGVPDMDIDAAHLIDDQTLVFSTAQNENIDGFAYEDGDLILYDYALDTFSEFFSEDFFSGNADINALYIVSHDVSQSVFLISVDGNETIGGNNFSDGDVFQVIYDRVGGTVTTSTVLDESIYGTNVDVDAVHLLDSGHYVLSMTNNETINGFNYEDGDLIEYDPVGGTFSEFLSEDNFSGNEDINAVTQLPATPSIHHYAISYPSGFPGVTCDALTVQFTAHDNGDNPVTPASTTTVTVSAQALNAGDVSWTVTNPIANPGSFTDNGDGTASYDLGTAESSVQLELRYPYAETFDIDVSGGGASDQDGVAEDTDAEFVDSAFRITDSPLVAGSGTAITSKIAGKVSNSAGFGQQTLYLQAIQTDTETGSCTGVFQGAPLTPVTVQMASECENPGACEGIAVQVQDNSASFQPIGLNNSSAGVPSNYSNITLDFDANSAAPLVFNYADAGRMTLHARYDIDPDPGNTVYMSGASNSFGNGFVVKPAGLCVESPDAGAACTDPTPPFASCSVFRKAGSVDAENFFNLTVRGVTWESAGEADTQFCTGSNATTPNFELNNIALTHSLVAPVGAGTAAGALGVNTVNVVDAGNGSVTASTQSISEVGVFTITAGPPLYQGETIAASTTANIGRFIPDRFNVAMQNTPAFGDACTGFTYQDQPFYYDDTPSSQAPVLAVTALNSNGNTTVNYGGDFWRLTGGVLNRDYSDGSAPAPAASFSPTTTQSGNFSLAGDTDYDGLGTFTLVPGSGGDAFMYQKAIPLDTPEEPFDADVDVVFAAAGFQDADHSAPARTVCYDSNNDNSCEDFSYTGIGGTELRWGRMVVNNGQTSELLPLPVPLRTEYFTGGVFTTNSDDNCTTYQAAEAALTDVSAGDNLVPGDTSVINPVATTTVVNGVSVPGDHLTVGAPGAGKTGSLDLDVDVSAAGSDQPWLQFNGANPGGRVTFGVYRGIENVIFVREPWN